MTRARRRERTAHAVFTRRTQLMFLQHQKRAGPVALDYDLAALRNAVRLALDAGDCPFCGRAITERDFGVDHATPLSRGGGHAFANLLVCCQPCNTAKGPLTAEEFHSLLCVLDTFQPNVSLNTLARLRAGSRQAKFRARHT